MGRFLALVVCEAREAAAHPDSCHVPRVARYDSGTGNNKPLLVTDSSTVTIGVTLVQHLHHPTSSHEYVGHVERIMK